MARHLTLLEPDPGEPGRMSPAGEPPSGAIVHVVAARRDAIALSPVVDAIRQTGASPQIVLDIGQRKDHAGMQELFAESIGALPLIELRVTRGATGATTARALVEGEALLARLDPVVVVVAGASDTGFGCALAATRLGIPVARVEAGLREHDWRVPAEINRVLIDTMADMLFAPSQDAAANLVTAGMQEARVHVVGSTVVAAAVARAEQALDRAAWTRHKARRGRYVLVALSRHENIHRDERLARVVEAVAALARRLPVIVTLPREARGRLQSMGDEHRLRQAGARCVSPRGYLDGLSLQAGAGAILTDLGDVQEEASALGVPCFTLGAVTDRTMTLTHGSNTLLGDDPRDIDAVAFPPLPASTSLFSRWHAGAGERVAAEIVANYALVRATGAS